MNNKIKSFTKNVSYTFFSNLLSIIITTFLILIVPKFISVNDYGYWQLFIFYSSYISYMSFGITDGSYLRYGGTSYKKLDKPVFVSQYWFLFVANLFVDSSIVLIYGATSTDLNKTIVIFLTALSGILVVPRSLITFMLQATNRIKDFSIVIVLERSVYLVLVIIFLLSGVKRFEFLIFADIFGKLCSVIYSWSICKELVFGQFASAKRSLKEIKENISAGIKLLLANVAGLLIIGIVRFCIERNWSIGMFGKISLALSMSNMLLLFINAVGVVLFPALRRTSEKNLPTIYKIMRTSITIPLIGLLLFYYPTKIILSSWLPQYSDSLIYFGILFPICIYESKMQLLINTFLKTLRKENMMMVVNFITVFISIILTSISVFILNSLNLTVLLILILLAFRCIISELYLVKKLKVSVLKDILAELCMTVIFVVITWFLNSILGVTLYCIIFFGYLIIKKGDIAYLLKGFKVLLGSR